MIVLTLISCNSGDVNTLRYTFQLTRIKFKDLSVDLYVNHTITACVQIWDWQCCWHELRQRTECYHKTFHSSTIFFRECLKLHWVWVGTLWNTGRFLRNFFSVSRFLNFIQTFSFGQNQTYTITKLSWYEVWWGLGRGRGTHVLA